MPSIAEECLVLSSSPSVEDLLSYISSWTHEGSRIISSASLANRQLTEILLPLPKSDSNSTYSNSVGIHSNNRESQAVPISITQLLQDPSSGRWRGGGAVQDILELLSGGLSHLSQHKTSPTLAQGVTLSQDILSYFIQIPPPLLERNVLDVHAAQGERRELLPTKFSPSLLLLLFHSHAVIHRWALDTSIKIVRDAAMGIHVSSDSDEDEVPSAPAVDENNPNDLTKKAKNPTIEQIQLQRWKNLWQIVVSVLAVVRYITSTIPPLLVKSGPVPVSGGASNTNNSKASNIDGGHSNKSENSVKISMGRLEVWVRGFHGLLTLFTVLDQRLTQATRDVGQEVAATLDAHPVVSLLLGGTLLFQWLFRVQQDLARHYREMHHDAVQERNKAALRANMSKQKILGSFVLAGVQRVRPEFIDTVSRQIMDRITRCLNTCITRHSEEGGTQYVQQMEILKGVMKVAAHGLLDSAKGIPVDKMEEEWRWGRVCLWWLFLSKLNPPPPVKLNVGKNTNGSNDNSTQQGNKDANRPSATPIAPCRSAGWLLQVLLLNAKRQFNFADAVVEAKERTSIRHNGPRNYNQAAVGEAGSGTGAEVVSHDETLLDIANYAMLILFQTLEIVIPKLFYSVHFHQLIEQHEQELFTILIGGVIVRQSLHGVCLLNLFMRSDIVCFAPDKSSNYAQLTAFSRIWLNYPMILKQAVKVNVHYTIILGLVENLSTILFSLGDIHNEGNAVNEVANSSGNSSPMHVPLPSSPWILTLTDFNDSVSPLAKIVGSTFTIKLDETLKELQKEIKHIMNAEEQRIERVTNNTANSHNNNNGNRNTFMFTSAPSGNANQVMVNRLLSCSSCIPNIAHVFGLAPAAPLHRLAEDLVQIFLSSLSNDVHEMYESEAAEWLWVNAVLAQKELTGFDRKEHFLALQIPAVDNLARAQGKMWLRYLGKCHLDVMRPNLQAMGWWMAALLADVVSLSGEERVVLIDRVITQLPPLDLTVRSNISGDTTPPVESVPTWHECVAELSGAVDGGGINLLASSQLYQIVKHVLLCLLQKDGSYPQDMFATAVLHVAGAIPAAYMERHDPRLKVLVTKHLTRVLQGLQPTHQETIRQHAPLWLVNALRQAEMTIEEKIKEQDRCFKQFEWEEKRLEQQEKERKLKEAEEARQRQLNDAKRSLEIEKQRKEAKPYVSSIPIPAPQPPTATVKTASSSSPAITTVAASKKRRLPFEDSGEEEEELIDDEENSDSDVEIVERPPNKLPTRKLDDVKETHVAAAQRARPADVSLGQSRLKQKLQSLMDQSVHKAMHSDNQRGLEEKMIGVVIRTNIVLEQPFIDDVVGTASTCLATEIPVLPEIFVSTNAAVMNQVNIIPSLMPTNTSMMHSMQIASQIYAKSFAPHIALELRHDVFKNAHEWIDFCRRHGYVTPPLFKQDQFDPRGRGRNTRYEYRHSAQGGEVEGTVNSGGQSQKYTYEDLVKRFPLSRKVVNDSAKVLLQGVTSSQHTSTESELNMTFAPIFDGDSKYKDEKKDKHFEHPNSKKRQVLRKSKYHNLSEADIVLLLIPLPNFLSSFLDYQSTRLNLSKEELMQSLPKPWLDLGCYPQICYVNFIDDKQVKLSATFMKSRLPPKSQPMSAAANKAGNKNTGLHIPDDVYKSLRFHFVQITQILPRPNNSNVECQLYIKRLSTLNSTFASLRSLHEIYNTPFSKTIYDPTLTSKMSETYNTAITNFLSEHTGRLSQMRERLLLGLRLNDWQVKAIISVLYALKPDWDRGVPVLKASTLTVIDTPSLAEADFGRKLFPPDLLIVEGPPGTGKTQTIASLVLNTLLHFPNARVLMCAPSNCAVDEVLLRIKQLQKDVKDSSLYDAAQRGHTGFKRAVESFVLRLGVRDNVDEEVLELRPFVFLDDIVDAQMGNVESQYRRHRYECRHGVVQSAGVIVSTLGSLNQVVKYAKKFDLVIIDESSQGTEPDTLQALIMAGKKCVLVGDSKQLQPTILCKQASQHGLRRSLLVRLLRNGHQSFILRTQYRMHPDICSFPNKYIYDGKLRTAPSVLERSAFLPKAGGAMGTSNTWSEFTIAQKLNKLPRFSFVNVEGSMASGGNYSQINKEEASALLQHLRQIRQFLRLEWKEFGPKVGIITFYKAQRDLIFSYMNKDERESVQVATVDSFQGKEKDIILISCVRTFRDGQKERIDRRLARTYEEGEGEEIECGVSRPVDNEEAEIFEFVNGEAQYGLTAEKDSSSHRVLEEGVLSHIITGDNPGRVYEKEGVDKREIYLATRQTLGFVSDWHRINVSLTRAKDMCLVYGSAPLFEYINQELQSQLKPGEGSNDAPLVQPERTLQSAVLTTAATSIDSSKLEVLEALQAADEDPFLLGTLIQHCKYSLLCAYYRNHPDRTSIVEVGNSEEEKHNKCTTGREELVRFGPDDTAMLRKVLNVVIQPEYIRKMKEESSNMVINNVNAAYLDFDPRDNIFDILTALAQN